MMLRASILATLVLSSSWVAASDSSQENSLALPVMSETGQRINYTQEQLAPVAAAQAATLRGTSAEPRSDTLATRTTTKSASLSATTSTLPPVPTSGAFPFWQYAIYGTNLGNRGMLLVPNGDKVDLWLTRCAAGGFGSPDSWMVLRYSNGDYAQQYVHPPYQSPTNSYPYTRIVRMALEDLDRDGKPEVFVALSDGRFFVYDPQTRELEKSFTVTGAGEVLDCAAADIEGDEQPELLFTNSGKLIVCDNAGLLKWSLTGPGGSSVVAGQFDDDASLEIATSGQSKGMVIDVATRVVQWENTASFGQTLLVANVDQDAKMELIAAQGWYWVDVWDVDTKLKIQTIRTDLDIACVTLANIDQDAMPELIIGDGQWGDVYSYDFASKSVVWTLRNPDHGVAGIAYGDVNGDGVQDVIWGAGASSTGADYLHIDKPTGGAHWQSLSLDGPFVGPEIGDVDGDGELELVTCTWESESGYGSGRILIFDAKTYRLEGISNEVAGGSSWTGVKDIRLRNVQGDARPEILIACDWLYDGVIEVYSYSGGVFSMIWTNPVRPSGSPFNCVEAMDVDGDGQIEIIAGNGVDHTGSEGTFIRVYDYATKALEWKSVHTGYSLNQVAVGNFDSDVGLEIAASGFESPIFVWDVATRGLQAQVAGQFTYLASLQNALYAGDKSGVIRRYKAGVSGTLEPEVLLPASTPAAAIEGITLLSPDEAYFSHGGKMRRRNFAAGADDWFTGAFDRHPGKRVATYVNNGVTTVFAAAKGVVAAFNFQPTVPKPVVSIASASSSAIEGGGITVKILRIGPTAEPLSVTLSTGGTATANLDYSLPAMPILLPGGQTEVSFIVPALADDLVESTESIDLQIQAAPASFDIGVGSVSLSVLDDEPTVTMSVISASLYEGGAVGKFAISRTGDTSKALPVSLKAAGTANPLADYIFSPAEFEIPAGSSNLQVEIHAVDDNEGEVTESIAMQLAATARYRVGSGTTASFSLYDNEPEIRLSTLDAWIAEDASEDVRYGLFVVERIGNDHTITTTVQLKLSGSAQAGADYVAPSLEVAIPPGKTGILVRVDILQDSVVEPPESVELTVLPAAGYRVSTGLTRSFTILDGEPVIEPRTVFVSSLHHVLSEGGTGRLRLTRTGSLAAPLTVELAWGGTATEADVTGQISSVTIPAGQSVLDIDVPVLADQLNEADEVVELILQSADDAQIGDPATAGFVIRDVPSSVTIVQVRALNRQVVEHSSAKGRFEFSRSGNLENALTVLLSFGGTADAGKDYARQSSILTFAPGMSRTVMAIPVFSDDEEEETETVSVSIQPGGYSAGPNGSASFEIKDGKSNLESVISIDAAGRKPRNNQPSRSTSFVIKRQGSEEALEVDLVIGGSAVPGRDYEELPATVRFPAGQRSAKITLKPLKGSSNAPRTVKVTLARGSYKIAGRRTIALGLPGSN